MRMCAPLDRHDPADWPARSKWCCCCGGNTVTNPGTLNRFNFTAYAFQASLTGCVYSLQILAANRIRATKSRRWFATASASSFKPAAAAASPASSSSSSSRSISPSTCPTAGRNGSSTPCFTAGVREEKSILNLIQKAWYKFSARLADFVSTDQPLLEGAGCAVQ